MLHLQNFDLGLWFGFQSTLADTSPVQKLSNSRSWFALGWFRFRLFWKIVNQDDEMTIPIALWKFTDVHSNLFHHTGCYWYQLQLYLWRLQVTLFLALFATLNIFIDISSYVMPKKYLYNPVMRSVFSSMWGHCLGELRNLNTSVYVSDNFPLAFFVFDNLW